jgi:hypothetical protein
VESIVQIEDAHRKLGRFSPLFKLAVEDTREILKNASGY